MTDKLIALTSAAVALTGLAASAAPAWAQTPEVKEKPPLYSYIAEFAFPRNKWAELDKQAAGVDKVFEKALAAGSLVGYGHDASVVHSADGYTHDSFWSGMSMAAVLGVLDELDKAGPGAALNSATKHEDNLLVSRYYNWKPGTHVKGAYTHVASYDLKESAPDNALDVIAKGFGVPLFEKLLADGAIVEYEIDQEQIHTVSVNRFWVTYICPDAAGLDKVAAALDSAFGASGLLGPAVNGLTSSEHHQDYLDHTVAVYK